MSGAPGSGGKSLELMQRRMLSGQGPAPAPSAPGNQPSQQQSPQQQSPQQQPPQQQAQAQAANPGPRPGKTAASLMATQAREQAATAAQPKQEQPVPVPVAAPAPGGRPKGKDFAAMAMKSRGPIAPAPTPVAPAPAIAPAPVMAPGISPPGGRPKGKDFSALANRMGAPPPAAAPAAPSHVPATQNIQFTPAEDEAQRLRARKMQAAARAAAGLPPLENLTATSVTTIPPPISPPKQSRPAPTQGVPAHSSSMQDVRHHQQLQRQQQQQHIQQQQQLQQYKQQQALLNRQPQAPRRSSPSAARASPKTASATAAATAADQYMQSRLTAQPTEHEGRLSKASKSTKSGAASRASAADKASAATGAPHMAPLLGERVQDILNGIDPTYVMETEAEEQVLQLADDFLDKVIRQSLRLAQHRGSKALDVQDVQLILAKHWGIVVPGLGLPNIRPLRPGKQSVSKTPSSGGSQANKRKSATDSSAPSNRKKSNSGMSPMPQPMQMS
jgi:hypothetical protein